MPTTATDDLAFKGHGSPKLAEVHIDSYSLELRDDDGELIGDAGSQTAFRKLLRRWRKKARKTGTDPIGKGNLRDIGKKRLDRKVRESPKAQALVHGAADDFADQFARTLREFRHHKTWRGIERVIVGGGFQQSEVGQRAIERAFVVLRSEGIECDLRTLKHPADDGGLVGWVHLAPRRMLVNGYDALLAVDIGGTNVRCGIVELNMDKADDLSRARVVKRLKWRHKDDQPTRRHLVERLVEMLGELMTYAEKRKLRLAPFIGVACPGLIRADGSIAAGTQNLPGDWERRDFHLPTRLAKAIPRIDGRKTRVMIHNDAVVQGLSELPFMQDVKRWAVLTIGTGLGNVTYTNLSAD